MSIEKQCSTMKTYHSKEINHVGFSSELSKLAQIEEKNGNSRLSTFWKFQSEKIMMSDCKFDERSCTENSFTVSCGFQLHN